MEGRIENVKELQNLLSKEWREALKDEMNKPYWSKLVDLLNSGPYYPVKKNIFAALNSCPPDKVKVVLLGQDPYIKEGQAHGYSFSVSPGTLVPPSLKNMYVELKNEYGDKAKNINMNNGCLTGWANQGILLLNTILTVQPGKSNSHKNKGWESFTSSVIEYLDLLSIKNPEGKKIIFMALGTSASCICKSMVVNSIILEAGHPSPLNTSNPFIGSGIFKMVNDILEEQEDKQIDWFALL